MCGVMAGAGREVRHGLALGLGLTAFGILVLIATVGTAGSENLGLSALSVLLTPPASVLGAWLRARRTAAQPAA